MVQMTVTMVQNRSNFIFNSCRFLFLKNDHIRLYLRRYEVQRQKELSHLSMIFTADSSVSTGCVPACWDATGPP